MTESAELAGGVAIVTGGSRGIGLAVSKALAKAGARVAVVARNFEGAKSAAGDLEGGGHRAFSCDVADADACRDTVALAESETGPVTVLVNNAGITRDNILLRMRDADWDRVIATNLGGAFNMIRAVTRSMMKRRGGSIINVSSVVGLTGNAGQANYAASKAGIHGLTKSVAKELASRNIRCNVVAPGLVRTDMTAVLNERVAAEMKKKIPLGRMGEPEDIAGLVRFSRDHKHVTLLAKSFQLTAAWPCDGQTGARQADTVPKRGICASVGRTFNLPSSNTLSHQQQLGRVAKDVRQPGSRSQADLSSRSSELSPKK